MMSRLADVFKEKNLLTARYLEKYLNLELEIWSADSGLVLLPQDTQDT